MNQRPLVDPTEAEIAWAAGLYEGEGTAIWLKSGRGQWLAVRMTDREPVQELCRIFGGNFKDGHINPGEVGKGYKPKYMWRISAWRDIIRVSEAIYTWLSPRRKAQLDKVLAHRPEFPRGERACPAEPFPSVLGYTRHRRLGEPACELCMESNRLYWAKHRVGRLDKIKATNREQYLRRKSQRDSLNTE